MEFIVPVFPKSRVYKFTNEGKVVPALVSIQNSQKKIAFELEK